VFSPVVTLWIFALPIYDLFSSMVRRMSNGLSPFHGDSDHLHHVLRRAGLSSRKVAQVVLVGATVTSAIGIGGYRAGLADGWLFVGWLASGVLYHVVFGSGLFVGRRVDSPPGDGFFSSAYWALLRQRRR
jgi:hypothetical protein